MRLWELVKLALDGVRRTPLRVALTALGVAIATGALVSMVGFAEGLQNQAEKPFRELELLNRIEVYREKPDAPATEGSGKRARRRDTSVPLTDADVEALAKVPRVALAYPQIWKGDIEIEANGKKTSTFAMGVPREGAKLQAYRQIVIAGRYLEPGSAAEMLLPKGLLEALGFAKPDEALGKVVQLKAWGLVPALPLGLRPETRESKLTIVGVYEAPGWGAMVPGASALFLPIDVIRALPGVNAEALMQRMREGGSPTPEDVGFFRIYVRTEKTSDVAGVEKAIGALGYKTTSLASQLEGMKTFFIVLDVLLGAVGAVALVVAGLGIVNTLLMAVLERTKEIGAFKAVGASDGDVRVLFLAEAGLVGMLGGIGGIGLGRVVSAIIGAAVNVYARRKGVEHDVALFVFPAWLLGGAIVFAIAASVVSGVYPASRAAKVDPIRALRGE